MTSWASIACVLGVLIAGCAYWTARHQVIDDRYFISFDFDERVVRISCNCSLPAHLIHVEIIVLVYDLFCSPAAPRCMTLMNMNGRMKVESLVP